ncbi:ankyrin repeat protein [Fusarium austroafricanum]|uniref:Ankyrin repeat protein n=1 Tax=Fusarium austroafricanum TaxID=2364996 RepID=A0A8H4P477_9HYPO|nr:ankyrin repeat protein [Fusarium austroafricanum]
MSLSLFAIAILMAPGCAAAEFSDDFANNLFTDLAPLIALFGERVTMQFLSQATGWADSFTLAMAPLGIITIIISAIRVGGPSWLKAIIGRARENLAAAEVELMSSTSEEVCELWNGSEIVRSLGSPPVREFICLVPRRRDGSPSTFENNPNIECRKYNDFESAKTPNISLNVHVQKREEVRIAAVLGTILQLGVLVYSGFATYYYTMRFSKEPGEPVASYAFPYVVEKRTEEVTQSTIEGYEAYTIWVQKQATVGDQVFRSFGIFSNTSKTEITTSRRHDTIQGPRDLSIVDTIVKVMSYVPLKLAQILRTLLGKRELSKKGDESFIGLRGMHWSVSIVQLAAVAIMTAARAFIRRQLAVPPQAQPLSRDFELEWLASTVADRDDGPWGNFQSDSPTCGKHWLVLTGGNDIRDPLADIPNDQRIRGESSDLKEDQENSWRLSEDAGDNLIESNIDVSSNANSEPEHRLSLEITDELHARNGIFEQEYNRLTTREDSVASKAQTVMNLRSQLGELTGWRSPVVTETYSLVRAIQVVMNTLFFDSPQEKIQCSLRATYRDSDPQPVQLCIYRDQVNWKINPYDVEAVLSFWISAVQEHQNLNLRQEKSYSAMNARSLRLLGQDTTALRRDLQWWMPRELKKTIVVAESLQGSLIVETPRIVGAGRNEVVLSRHNRLATFERMELDGSQQSPPLETTDFDESNVDPPFGRTVPSGLLAAESFTGLASLYALDLFSSFMWTVAEKMTSPITGQADARPNDINGLGSLDEIYLSIIPPLSKARKLPQVDCIIDLAREHALPYEKRGDVEKVTIDYVWLLRTAYTFPRDDIITLKSMAVMLEHLGQLYQETDLSGLIQESDLIPRLQNWIENELDLQDLDNQRLFTQVMRIYFDQRREKRFPDILTQLAGSNPTFQRMARLFSSRAKRTRDEACGKGDITGWTQLHWDAATGENSQVRALLKLDANIHSQDPLGQTPLHYTCKAERLDIAALLIQNAADVNAPARNGWTPLHCAVIYGYQTIIELLVESGANVDAIDSSRKTPTMWAAFRGHWKALNY